MTPTSAFTQQHMLFPISSPHLGGAGYDQIQAECPKSDPGQTAVTSAPSATSIPTPRETATPSRDTGHLYVGPHTKGHYISSAHFALISQEIAAINDLLRDQRGYSRDTTQTSRGQNYPVSPPLSAAPFDSANPSYNTTPVERPENRELYGDLFPNIPAWTPQDNTLMTSQAPSIDEILAGLPSREQSEVLIWSYMGGYHAKVCQQPFILV